MTSPVPKSAPSKREALRELLADGQWHHMSELQRVGGARYGARLFELRRSKSPVFTEHRLASSKRDNEFEYRACAEEAQTALPFTKKSRRDGDARLVRELLEENTALKARIAQLEGGAHAQ